MSVCRVNILEARAGEGASRKGGGLEEVLAGEWNGEVCI